MEKQEKINANRISPTRSLCYIALFVCVIVVCTYISIPFVVPFTMQTFAIFLSIFMLGWWRTEIAVLVYICLGIIGIPVFAGFNSGIGTVVGPTGGFLIGFLFMCPIAGIFELFLKKFYLRIFGMIVPLFVCYAIGVIWFVYIFSKGAVELSYVLSVCVLPFIIPDVVKIILASYLAERCKKISLTNERKND